MYLSNDKKKNALLCLLACSIRKYALDLRGPDPSKVLGLGLKAYVSMLAVRNKSEEADWGMSKKKKAAPNISSKQFYSKPCGHEKSMS